MKGYAGKILKVNLSHGKILKETLRENFAKNYLGGTGFCARILWDSVDKNVEPLSEDNIIIFATGPVNGTAFPPSGRYVISSKSPLTRIWAESHSGGFFGAWLKYAGYDIMIIQGKSDKPVWLKIEDENVEICDASDMWGRNTLETTEMIEESMGDDTRVACIGQGGENLVKYACIMNDRYRAAGRTGMGAIMGFKKLKAIGVIGTSFVEVYDYDRFIEIVEDARRRYTEGRWGIACQESLGMYGTTSLVEVEQEIGRLPTKNHYTGIFDDYEKIGSMAIRKNHRKKRKSCFGCFIQCKYISEVSDGKYAGTVSEGPEYETVMAFGSNCLNNNLQSIIHANMLCNLYGLDTISTGKCISFAMECYEKGLIDYDVKWGDDEKIIDLIHKIARREGFGDLLAEGTRIAAQKIGKGAENYAMHVKGMEISGQDGRPQKSVALTHAISVRGADHLRSLSSLEELGYVSVMKERFKDMPEGMDDLRSEDGKGMLIVEMEDLYAIVDSLIICKYGTMWPPIFYFNDFCDLVPAITGFDEYSEYKNMKKLSKRISLLRRAFNAREGIRRKDDYLPKRFLNEPMPHGPAKGEVVNLDKMLDEFYELRGCNKDGVPTKDALDSVGLKDITENLWR